MPGSWFLAGTDEMTSRPQDRLPAPDLPPRSYPWPVNAWSDRDRGNAALPPPRTPPPGPCVEKTNTLQSYWASVAGGVSIACAPHLNQYQRMAIVFPPWYLRAI